eukprot:11183910-Lingulodinium_polyedra.AAC.1
MARPNRRFAAASACKTHARALHARTRNWPAHGTREHAMREPLQPRTVDSTASLRGGSQTPRNDA